MGPILAIAAVAASAASSAASAAAGAVGAGFAMAGAAASAAGSAVAGAVGGISTSTLVSTGVSTALSTAQFIAQKVGSSKGGGGGSRTIGSSLAGKVNPALGKLAGLKEGQAPAPDQPAPKLAGPSNSALAQIAAKGGAAAAGPNKVPSGLNRFMSSKGTVPPKTAKGGPGPRKAVTRQAFKFRVLDQQTQKQTPVDGQPQQDEPQQNEHQDEEKMIVAEDDPNGAPADESYTPYSAFADADVNSVGDDGGAGGAFDAADADHDVDMGLVDENYSAVEGGHGAHACTDGVTAHHQLC
eukprot:tig00021759_g23421.t1